jgi:hypothetical protein
LPSAAVGGPAKPSGWGEGATVEGPTTSVETPAADSSRTVASSIAAHGGLRMPETGVVSRDSATTSRPRSSCTDRSRERPSATSDGSSGAENGSALTRTFGA